jgi:hypothetical protein
MPAKSEKQLKFIYALRNRYKSKTKTPKKYKWVWNDEWLHLKKESYILKFDQFIQ